VIRTQWRFFSQGTVDAGRKITPVQAANFMNGGDLSEDPIEAIERSDSVRFGHRGVIEGRVDEVE
jgi:hypothetical protein